MAVTGGRVGFEPFVPAPLLDPSGRWAPPQEVPASSGAQPVALALADVSGFTTLTSALAADGEGGAERVGEVLDAVFGRLVGLLESCGGVPVASAGDSLLAMWPSTGPTLENAAVAARRWADAASSIEMTVGDVELSVHVGVAAGEAELLHVGDEPRHLVLVGPAAVAVGEAATRAPSGGVALDDVAADVLERATAPVVAAAATGVPTLPDLAERYVPDVVRERIAMGHGEWLAELRQVSAVFVGLPSDTSSLEHWHRIFNVVNGVTDRFEGELAHVMVDDKGASLMVLFGLPPRAHERDAVRATRAAQALHRGLGAIDVVASVGVATGRVYSGPVGTPTWRRYTVIGETINRAARLMSIAGDGVRCDDATADSAGRHQRFRSAGAVALKGMQGEVPTWEPGEPLDTAPRPVATEMVGREDERALVSRALDRLAVGQGSVLVIEGEAGTGKSRLLAHVRSEAVRVGVAVLEVEGDAIERDVPYRPWLGAIGGLLDEFPDETDAAEQRAVLVEELRARFEATQPAGLIVEDAHWFDSASWSLLSALRAAVPSTLFVIATRPVPHPSVEELTLRHDPTASVIRLDGLSEGAVAALAASTLGTETVHAQLVDHLVARSDGNPFFVQELVLAMREVGAVTTDGGIGRLADRSGDLLAAVPTTLDGIVVSRLDRLPAGEQLTAKVASVVGRRFTAGAVAGIHPVADDASRVPDLLDGLAVAQVATRTESPEADWAFRHAITRDVAYSLLSASQRQRLHGAMAGWLRRNVGEEGPVAGVVAHHHDLAGDAASARRCYELAGDHALARGAHREAAAAYDRGLELAPDAQARTREHARLAPRLSRARLGHGDFAGAFHDLGIALEDLGYRVSAPAPVLLPAIVGSAVRLLGRGLLPSGARRPRGGWSGVEEVDLIWAFALCSSFATTSYVSATPHVVLRGLHRAERAGDRHAVAVLESMLGIGLAVTPMKRLARRFADRALRSAGAADGDTATTRACAHLADASVAAWTGEVRRSLQTAVSAHDLFIGAGERRRAADAVCLAGFSAYWTGDFDECDAVARAMWEESGRDENEQMQAYSVIARLLRCMATGEDDEGRRLAALLRELDPERVAPQERAFRIAASALVRHLDGADVTADLAEVAALMRADRILTVPGRWHVYWILASIGLEHEAETGQARSDVTTFGLRGLRRYSRTLPVALPAAHRCRALSLALAGRHRRAARAFQRSIGHAARLEMPHQEGLTELVWGAHGCADPAAARRHLERADRLLSSVGAHGDARRARAELARLDVG